MSQFSAFSTVYLLGWIVMLFLLCVFVFLSSNKEE